MQRTIRDKGKARRICAGAWGGAGLLLLLSISNVASAQTWQIDYDASLGTLPDAQGFTEATFDPPPGDMLNTGNYLVALGALTQGGTGGPNMDPGNTQWWEVTPPLFDFEADLIVVDLRLKILSSTLTAPPQPTPRAGFGVVVRDESGEFVILYIGSTGFFLWGSDTAAGVSLFAPFDATLDFADYQLRIGSDGAQVLVDGILLATLERDEFPSTPFSRTVYFGDVSGSGISSSQIESFRVSRFVPPAAEVVNYETVTMYTATNSNSTKSLPVACPTGKKALGGGGETIDADGSVALTDSRPSGGPPATSWFAAARELVDTDDTWRLRVDVICGEVSGYENVSFSPPHTTAAVQGAAIDCANNGKAVFGGGGGFTGADLRQTLIATGTFIPHLEFEPDGGAALKDYGVATSSSPWGVEADAICTDALRLRPTTLIGAQEPGSPKTLVDNCTSGKVPISGGVAIAGWAGGEPALRRSRPKDGTPPAPPVGWSAQGQVDTAPLWSLDIDMTCAPIADPTVTKTGLMGRWRGENAGFDSWDSGHATLMNGVGFQPGILGQGQSFSFDGVSDQWLSIPSSLPFLTGSGLAFDLYPEASFTVEAWFKTSTLPSTAAMIVSLNDGGGLNPGGFNQSSWSLRLDDKGLPLGAFRHATAAGGSTIAGPGPDNLADGELHHLAMVRDLDANQFRLYVDGLLEGVESIQNGVDDGPLEPGAVTSPDPVSVGVFRTGGATTVQFPFEGLIDDVKYYDRALSEEEIENTAGCSIALAPRVLNLDASLFGSPAADDHKLCVFLEAGNYDATLVNPGLDPDARLTAWAPSATAPWSTEYVIEPETDPNQVGGFTASASTPQQAFDATPIKTTNFTLTVDQRVHFSVVDDEVLDNRGGVSVEIIQVPEPGAAWMLASGCALLARLARGRRARRTERNASAGAV